MPARRDIPVPELAEERTAAMRQVYAQVRKREAQRRALSDAIRAELRAVKELSPVAPASIREAARINRMAPERRIKWEAKLNGALGLLGYSQIVLTDNPVSARSNSAAAARQTIERLEAERREEVAIREKEEAEWRERELEERYRELEERLEEEDEYEARMFIALKPMRLHLECMKELLATVGAKDV